jgi:hypothetical protein
LEGGLVGVVDRSVLGRGQRANVRFRDTADGSRAKRFEKALAVDGISSTSEPRQEETPIDFKDGIKVVDIVK